MLLVFVNVKLSVIFVKTFGKIAHSTFTIIFNCSKTSNQIILFKMYVNSFKHKTQEWCRPAPVAITWNHGPHLCWVLEVV
jgi:hypothetical protein